MIDDITYQHEERIAICMENGLSEEEAREIADKEIFSIDTSYFLKYARNRNQ